MASTLTSYEFIRVPLNFMYFLFCSPFRLSKQGKPDSDGEFQFTTKTSWFQKLPCAVFTILDILWMLHLIRSPLPIQNLRNPRLYISMFATVISQVGKLIYIKKLWTEKHLLLLLPNQLIKMKRNSLWGNTVNLKNSYQFATILIICAVYIVTALINFGRIYGFNSHYERHGYYRWWTDMIKVSRKIFFLGENGLLNSTTDLCWSDNLLGVLAAIGLLHRSKKDYQ